MLVGSMPVKNRRNGFKQLAGGLHGSVSTLGQQPFEILLHDGILQIQQSKPLDQLETLAKLPRPHQTFLP